MGKLRHVAIQCEDPNATANFYKEVFGLKEMYRRGIEERPDGGGAIYLSDGTINVAILKITKPDHPNYRPMGLNHIGFIVENLEETVAKAEKAGATTSRTGHQIVPGEFWEHKMFAPDGVQLDIYDIQGRGWPGVSALEDLGVKGESTVAAHSAGKSLADVK